jgi:hypothetical protein
MNPVMSRDSSVPQSALRAISQALDIRISGRRSWSVNRIRADTFSLGVRLSTRTHSFWSVSSRHSGRATVVITGSPAQSSPRSTAFSILGAYQPTVMCEGREYHERGCGSVLEAR